MVPSHGEDSGPSSLFTEHFTKSAPVTVRLRCVMYTERSEDKLCIRLQSQLCNVVEIVELQTIRHSVITLGLPCLLAPPLATQHVQHGSHRLKGLQYPERSGLR